MDFTDEDIRTLDALDRAMDAGEIAHVICQGQRLVVTPEAMTRFELHLGQTVTVGVGMAVHAFHVAQSEHLTAEALRRVRDDIALQCPSV